MKNSAPGAHSSRDKIASPTSSPKTSWNLKAMHYSTFKTNKTNVFPPRRRLVRGWLLRAHYLIPERRLTNKAVLPTCYFFFERDNDLRARLDALQYCRSLALVLLNCHQALTQQSLKHAQPVCNIASLLVRCLRGARQRVRGGSLRRVKTRMKR